MSASKQSRSLTASDRRSVDRLINFSDAVVAVAVTLLALPLVDIAGPEKGETVWALIAENSGPIYAFLFTFYVVVIMWAAHNRILNSIARYDAFIFWINATWLVSIVLLPWISAMYGETVLVGESGMGASGVGLLYWAAMAVISMLGSILGYHLRRHPEAHG